MNKCRIYQSFLDKVKQQLRGKRTNRKTRDFVDKWSLTLEGRHVFHNGRRVVPYEETDAIMKKEAETGAMPLSRDGAWTYLNERFVGFKQSKVMEWLKSVEQLQMIHRRPHAKSRINTQNREGVRNWRMAKKFDGPMALGVDLFVMPRPQWSHYKFFFIAVLQKTGFLWLVPITSKKAKAAKSALVKVFADCRKRFGAEPSAIISDDGGEFKGAFDKYIAQKGIKRHKVDHVSWVEKKNTTFARTFAVMRSMYGFKKALELTLQKVNNTVNRVTRKAPVDWTPEDFQKRQRRHNKKMAIHPKRRPPTVFYFDDKVRHMLRAALGKTAFYKSYEGMRSDHHGMWSKTRYKIQEKRKINGVWKYKVNARWWLPSQLQLCEGPVVTLQRTIEPVAIRKKPKRKKISKPKPAPAPVPAERVGLRRSTRIRRAPQRFGF